MFALSFKIAVEKINKSCLPAKIPWL